MCHDAIPFLLTYRPRQCAPYGLQLDLTDLNGRVILPVAPLNLVLVGLLELQHGELLPAALRHDFPGHRGLRCVRSRQDLLVIGMNRQHGPELHLLAHFAADTFDADSVAGCDTILLSPGLYDGVHMPSKGYRQTTIIRVAFHYRQRAVSARKSPVKSCPPNEGKV